MATVNYTSLLGLALPTTGDLSGSWGNEVNSYITQYVDSAVAGTQTISADTNTTLTVTNGSALSSSSAQYMILNCTGARTAARTVTLPASSRHYVVLNATTGGFAVNIVGAGPTTGISVANGERCVIAWNGSDYVKVASNAISNLTGTLPVANGGTGQTTYTDGQLLIGNSSGNTLAKATLTAGSGVSISNGAGAITISATGSGGTVTSVSGTGTVNGITLSGTVTSSGSLTLGGTLSGVSLTSQVTNTLPVGNGGTGATTLTGVLKGNGTSAFTAGTVSLTSEVAGTLPVGNGGTGATSLTANYALFGNSTSAVNASSLLQIVGSYIRPTAYADTVSAAGNTGTALTLTCTNGNVFTATLTGNATITLSSPVSTGSTSITLILTNDGTAGRTVAWAGGSFKFPGGAASLSRTTTANATDIWVFFTPDGGTTWYGNIAMKNMTA